MNSRIRALAQATAIAAIIGSAGVYAATPAFSAEMTVEVGGAALRFRGEGAKQLLFGELPVEHAVLAGDFLSRSALGLVGGGRRRRPVVGVGSTAGPGVACAEAPVVRTLGRSRRLVESFPELPSRACQLRRAASATRRR